MKLLIALVLIITAVTSCTRDTKEVVAREIGFYSSATFENVWTDYNPVKTSITVDSYHQVGDTVEGVRHGNKIYFVILKDIK